MMPILPDGPLARRLRRSFIIYAIIGISVPSLAVWIALELAK